jgi:RNA 3'-terminal phosphate cyclase
VEATVEPAGRLVPLVLEGAFSPREIEVLSASSNLPAHVRERQRDQTLALLAQRGLKAQATLLDVEAASPGSLVYIKARDGERLVGVSALGEKGKPAEKVATEAAAKFFWFLDGGGGAVDEHLADQLVLYMALADGESRFTTSQVSRHLLTNIWVIESFLGKIFEVDGDLGAPGRVVARGVAFGTAA